MQKDVVERVAKETHEEVRGEGAVHDRHHDRDPAGLHRGGRDRVPGASSSPSGPTTSPRPSWPSPATTPGGSCPGYVDRKIYKEDPFVSIDQEGVGEMMKMGVERGRKVREGPGAGHLRRARRRAGARSSSATRSAWTT